MSLNDNSKTTTTTTSNNNGLNLINNISKLLWALGSLPPSRAPNLHRPYSVDIHVAARDVSIGSLRSLRRLHQASLEVPPLPPNSQQTPNSISTWAYHARPGLDGSWEFGDFPYQDKSRDEDTLVPTRDKINGCRNLKEVYGLRKGGYNGRATVPMLWDVDQKEVICNESYDIIEFFNSGLRGLAQNPGLDLSPVELKGEIEEWNRVIYPNVNNGVYRYLCGDRLTLADICLFTTLIRFDVVYNVLFKSTKKKLLEFPNLHGYMRDIYQTPKVAATCNFPAIMDGYYQILFPLNPGSIRPVLPSGCDHEFLSRSHNRESMSPEDKRVQCVA
ncbi:Ribosomal protein L14p/L23e family protein [Hibiscus syriacus]|uniref:Ribosomal protein L14p/L23e family protein n=1 Tax=Hibiscus syriacus TaxID=106335 RepID=A0A6A2XVQ1_HIBSY|nr:Ribosomal protein L14p/L23e family protein [Hibiscus syriacus]